MQATRALMSLAMLMLLIVVPQNALAQGPAAQDTTPLFIQVHLSTCPRKPAAGELPRHRSKPAILRATHVWRRPYSNDTVDDQVCPSWRLRDAHSKRIERHRSDSADWQCSSNFLVPRGYDGFDKLSNRHRVRSPRVVKQLSGSHVGHVLGGKRPGGPSQRPGEHATSSQLDATGERAILH